jgi:glycosyltransferase involved in cell wall biosynthesis
MTGDAAPGTPRVLHLLWRGALRGAERHVLDLAAALADGRFASTVCFFARADGYADLLAEAGIPFVELGCTNPKLDLAAVRRFRAVLRRERAVVVHDHGAPLWARGVAKLAPSARVVYTEHLSTASPLRRAIYPIVRRVTDAHIAVSDAARSMLVGTLGVPAREVTVIPNMVDPGRVRPLPPGAVGEIRAGLGLGADDAVILTVGRLEPGKRTDRLLALLAPLLAERPSAHLLVVGEGAEEGRLRALAASATAGGRIRFLGARDDVPGLLAACDLFATATARESFGLAAAEAMLAGKPVVAVRVAGIDEVVEDGETGVLVDDTRLDRDLAAAVGALLDDPARRDELGAAGRRRVLERFGPDRVAGAVAEVYASVLATA